VVKLFPPFFSENVKKEGDRLASEVENLKPFKILGVNGEEILIKYVCLETMLDGKIKCILSDVSNNGRGNCWVCGATPTQMSAAKGVHHSFKPSTKGLSLGIAPLHSELRAFDWICKHAFHQGNSKVLELLPFKFGFQFLKNSIFTINIVLAIR